MSSETPIGEGMDASRVFNSEHNRLCDDCIEWENRGEDGGLE